MPRQKKPEGPPPPVNPPPLGSITRSYAEQNKGHIPRNTISFHDASGKWGFLSNFKQSNFQDNRGRTWQSGEHYFQAAKAWLSRDRIAFEKIKNTKAPVSAKNIGNKIKLDVEKWNEISKDIMIDALWWKILSNRSDRLELLTTDDWLIVEMRADFVWGSGLNTKGSIETPVDSWPGQNKLGESWMYIRARLQAMKENGIDLDLLKAEDFIPKYVDKDPLSDAESENDPSDDPENISDIEFAPGHATGDDELTLEFMEKMPSQTATLVQCNCDNPDSMVMKALHNLQGVFNDGMTELENRVEAANKSTNLALIEADVNQRKKLVRIILKEIETYEIRVIDLKHYIVRKVMEWEKEKTSGRLQTMKSIPDQSIQTEIEMEFHSDGATLKGRECSSPRGGVNAKVILAEGCIGSAVEGGGELIGNDEDSAWLDEDQFTTTAKEYDFDSVLGEEDSPAAAPQVRDGVDLVLNEEDSPAAASQVRDDQRPASPTKGLLTAPEKRGKSPDPKMKPNKRPRRDESLVPNDKVDGNSKAFKIIDIGYRYIKRKNGNKKTQPKLLKNVSIEDIPLSIQQRIIWKDARATRHRLDSIAVNEDAAVMGRCWRSDDNKLESREWDRKGECANCLEAKKNGEEDVVCFFFIKTPEICLFKSRDSLRE
ncbi:hypothetical protein BOTCAL_2020g00010 [Botryotinia calthae]|uniref:NADAR domain-containing protein n=1 Tax=Botryotinia calthae TaxID=38488 RepID=A0A4Y8C9N1_9HELO|nr:hypothetical protein BOTCAL_2020g00010 [Botryotinia calthae]